MAVVDGVLSRYYGMDLGSFNRRRKLDPMSMGSISLSSREWGKEVENEAIVAPLVWRRSRLRSNP